MGYMEAIGARKCTSARCAGLAARLALALALAGSFSAASALAGEAEGEDIEVHLPLIIEYGRLPSGAKRFYFLFLCHHTRLRSGELYSCHFGPFYFQGPGYKIAPPLLSAWRRNKDGSVTTCITPFFHKTRDAAGVIRDFHFVNYFQGPGYKLFFPLGYSVGPPGSRHTGFIPFYFGGPDFKVSPLLLSGWWRRQDGSEWTWITPLFHKTKNADGSLRHMHCFNYFQGPGYKVFFPLAYKVGEYTSVVPFYFQGPDYKVVPPLLSGWWRRPDGSAWTWITPLFHKTKNADGSLRHMHCFNYFQGPNYKVFFPLAYQVGEDVGVFPVYLQGPDFKVIPPLLSGWWRRPDGSEWTWITPLFHQTLNKDGSLRHMHCFSYFEGPGYKVFFPLAYKVGEYVGVLPFYFQGPDYKVIPPLLSGWWKRQDGSSQSWITPLYHHTRDAAGAIRSFHVANYFQGPGYKVFFPLAYKVGECAGVLPFYFQGPDFKVIPPLLSGWWRSSDGLEWTWITPLFHKTRNPDGSLRHMHCFNYFQGPNYKVFFPLAYKVGEYAGVLPVYLQGPDFKVSPPLLSGWWRRPDGSEWTWITPLFHRTRNPDGSFRHMHCFNYFQGPGYKVLFPLAYKVGEYAGVLPVYFQGPDFKVIPPLLSGWWRRQDGSSQSWITPFYHHTRDAAGAIRDFHIANYFQGPGYKVLFPLAYKVGEYAGVLPFYFQGPDFKVSPPLLSMWRRNEDGSATTCITPFFHKTRDAAGAIRDFHFANYFQGPGYKVFFPLAYKVGEYAGVLPVYFQGPDFKVSPPLLSGWWRRPDGSEWTWITPLFHRTRNPDGSLRHMHCFNYFQGPNYKVFFPLAYKVGEYAGVLPVYFQGPDFKVSPPLLSTWRRNEDGSATTCITPFFHKTRDAAGAIRDFHFANYFQGPNYKVLFPLAYKVGEYAGVLPVYFQGPDFKVSPPVLSTWRRNEDGSATTCITPFFHKTRDAAGAIRDFHFANYFQGPNYKVFFPLAYKVGEYSGVLPFYFQGPDFKISPPLLSAWRRNEDGSATTCITPFFHKTRDTAGAIRDFHLANYFQGPNYKVFFPLAYKVGEYSGVLPFYFQGPDFKISPPLLSAWHKNKDGSATTCITPFFHKTRDAAGAIRDFHFANYFQGPDYKVFFPLSYKVGEYSGVLPFYFQGPGFKISPPLLSAWRKSKDGSATTCITPFFHKTRDAAGAIRDFHIANYFQGPDYKVFFPLSYKVGEYAGVLPVYFQGPGFKISPPLLSTWRRNEDGSATTCITPFFHKTRDAAGAIRDFHIANYFQGPNYKVLFPLVYKVGEYASVLPVYFQGPNFKVSPPLLSGWWRRLDGSEWTWITPLFHKTKNADGSLRHMHCFNYFQGPNYKVFFPIAYQVGEDVGVFPVYLQGPDFKVIPPLLSGWWRRPDGSECTWITPLFHKTKNADGSLRHMHCFNYFQGPNYKVLFPLAYKVGEHAGVLPVYFQGPDFKVSPPLLSAWRRNEDGSTTTCITPFFHKTRDAAGAIRDFHFANYFQGPGYKLFFPLGYSVGPPGSRHTGFIPFYFGGPNYKTFLLLYWQWRDGRGDTRRSVPFLFYSRTATTGEKEVSVVPPIFLYRRGAALDRSFRTQARVFLYQRAGDDFEFNFLWRVFHVRREAGRTSASFFPLWWSERPSPDVPMKFQVLGGLIAARHCNYERGSYTYRILWFIRVGKRRHFKPVR